MTLSEYAAERIYESLTPAHVRVLRAMLTGATSTREIAKVVGTSPQTVKNHFGVIFDIFGLDSKLEVLTCILRSPTLERRISGLV